MANTAALRDPVWQFNDITLSLTDIDWVEIATVLAQIHLLRATAGL
jgi:hypothetical protein